MTDHIATDAQHVGVLRVYVLNAAGDVLPEWRSQEDIVVVTWQRCPHGDVAHGGGLVTDVWGRLEELVDLGGRVPSRRFFQLFFQPPFPLLFAQERVQVACLEKNASV